MTQAAGPYPEANITVQTASTPRHSHGNGHGPGQPDGASSSSGPLVVLGRASRGGPLDHIVLDAGHWPTRPGQIALAVYQFHVLPPLGSTVTFTSAPGKPRLTVVGYAASVARYGDAWVTPGQLTALRGQEAAPAELMLYTFTQAGTAQQISGDVAALKAALPARAVASYQSWLASADQTSAEQGINTPFTVAFALIGLVLAVLIVANVVSAAVVASYRRIGVLKSIGFTPMQVTATYLAQIGAPALAGCAAGTAVGNWWVHPMLIGGPASTVPPWINVTAPLGMLALTGLAALVPALHAGRLSAVQAITAGQAPRVGHRYRAHRLAGRLALPRPVTIGLAAPFSRPARSAVILAAITFGVTAVVLSVGLNSSLAKVAQVSNLGFGQVQVVLSGGPLQKLTASQQKKVAAALRAQPGTRRYVAESIVPTPSGLGDTLPGTRPVAAVADLQLPLAVYAYDGDSSWLGWDMITGHWYNRPGQVVVNTSFLTQTGRSVGDTIALTVNGKPATARITGQVFLPNTPSLFTSWQTLGGTASGLAPTAYNIELKPGTSPRAYATALANALGPQFGVPTTAQGGGGGILGFADTSLIRLLTLLVAALAGLGVLSSVLIITRERVRDLGIFKALGMTPRQAITMVTCWVIAPAIAAAAIALPAAILLHTITMQAIGRQVYTAIPGNILAVFRPAELLLLAASGLAIAAIGALLPASWAAASRTITALRAE